MANPNPTEARKAKRARRRGKPGTLEDARALLWRALSRAGELLEEEDPALSLKAIHAISQGAAAYARIVEVGELEARIAALEGDGSEEEGSGPRLGRGAA
ncbi:hypothetical protein DEDE109153_01070 [Deinococcus deserti]|uniref:Uncharacterized protein n=1 Tax=Deinococcus deserti (strain DSM 17065 / CIP 109153 / LMG 22923 / VCD115) TaxID=546414 RepID=X5GY18_DEIDV|nr:hypothetical protein [Deinococcus deserti]AHX26514.1 hypothetical protein Deide_13086 [Deinococcus deserti VCD115]